jgi:hypothetical protein
MLAMKGTVEIMPGAMNHGSWVKWPQPQPALSTYIASNTPESAGTLYTVGSGTTAIPMIGTVIVSINIKFWRRNPYLAGLTPTLHAVEQLEENKNEESKEDPHKKNSA